MNCGENAWMVECVSGSDYVYAAVQWRNNNINNMQFQINQNSTSHELLLSLIKTDRLLFFIIIY